MRSRLSSTCTYLVPGSILVFSRGAARVDRGRKQHERPDGEGEDGEQRLGPFLWRFWTRFRHVFRGSRSRRHAQPSLQAHVEASKKRPKWTIASRCEWTFASATVGPKALPRRRTHGFPSISGRRPVRSGARGPARDEAARFEIFPPRYRYVKKISMGGRRG